jgi:hypothetical protein
MKQEITQLQTMQTSIESMQKQINSMQALLQILHQQLFKLKNNNIVYEMIRVYILCLLLVPTMVYAQLFVANQATLH